MEVVGRVALVLIGVALVVYGGGIALLRGAFVPNSRAGGVEVSCALAGLGLIGTGLLA